MCRCNINTPGGRLLHLGSRNFNVVWHKIYVNFYCFTLLHMLSSQFHSVAISQYLISCYEAVLSCHPLVEALPPCGGRPGTPVSGRIPTILIMSALRPTPFSVLSDLEQLIRRRAHVPDLHDQTCNTRSLFLL